jgi:acyl transferase domain-containing protein
MILQYLAIALLFVQGPPAQVSQGQAPQASENAPAQTETPVDPYKTLEAASQTAYQRFSGLLDIFRGEIARTCNGERFKREKQKILDALKEYSKRESEYLSARINRQKTILDTLQVMHPESAPPDVDIEQVRADLTKARTDLANDVEHYKKTPGPGLEQAIVAEKDGIARLEEIIRLNGEEQTLNNQAKSDFDEAVRLQGTYLKEEEAGLLLLKEEASNWTQYLTKLTATRILVCTKQENTDLERPRLGAVPSQ